MPDAIGDADLAENVDLPPKTSVLSEIEFAELVYWHRAKILIITGTLLWDKNRCILAPDGGGEWIVDGPWRLYRYAGQRVTVEGTRFGFNGIDVRRFKLENRDWPMASLWVRLRRWIVS